MTLVAIDPGKKNLGVAVFREAVLTRAYLVPTKDIFMALPQCDEVVIEKMQVYPGKSVADKLIELSIISGEIAGAMFNAYGTKATYYLPREWKGQLPKGVSHDRLRNQLTEDEFSRIQLPRAKKTQLDVLDAVALGLSHLRKIGVRVGKCFTTRR